MKYANKRLIIRCILVVSALATSFMGFNATKGIGSLYYWPLLSASYALLIVIFPKLISLGAQSFGMIILNIVIYVRYVVVPLLFLLSAQVQTSMYLEFESQAQFLNEAFIIMLVELLVIMTIVQYCSGRFYDQQRYGTVNQHCHRFVMSKWPLLILVAVSLAVVLAVPEVRARYRVVFGISDFQGYEKLGTSGLLILIGDMFFILTPMALLRFFYSQNLKSQRKLYFYLSVLSLVPFLLIIKGTSRMSMVVPALAWLVIIYKLYPAQRKIATLMLCGLLGTMFALITMLKQYRYSAGGGELDVNLAKLALDGNAYSSNLLNMAKAVQLESQTIINGIVILANDIIVNAAVLSRFADSSLTSTTLFNDLIYGGVGARDQVIPITGQGLLYFGHPLSLVMPCVALFMMFYFDSKSIGEKRIEYVFLWSSLTVSFSMFLFLSANSLFPIIINFALPMFVIFKLSTIRLRSNG